MGRKQISQPSVCWLAPGKRSISITNSSPHGATYFLLNELQRALHSSREKTGIDLKGQVFRCAAASHTSVPDHVFDPITPTLSTVSLPVVLGQISCELTHITISHRLAINSSHRHDAARRGPHRRLHQGVRIPSQESGSWLPSPA